MHFQNALKQQKLNILQVYKVEVPFLKINIWNKTRDLIWKHARAEGLCLVNPPWSPWHWNGNPTGFVGGPLQSQKSFIDHGQMCWSTYTSSRSVRVAGRGVCVCVSVYTYAWACTVWVLKNFCVLLVTVKLGRLCVFFKSMRMRWHPCMPWWSAGGRQSGRVEYCQS